MTSRASSSRGRCSRWRCLLRADLSGAFFIAGTRWSPAIGFGLAPAWRLSHANPNDASRTRAGPWHVVLAGSPRDLLGGRTDGAGAGAARRRRPAGAQPASTPAGAARHPARAGAHAAGDTATMQFQRNPFGVTAFLARSLRNWARCRRLRRPAAVTGLSVPTWNTVPPMDLLTRRPAVPEPGKFPTPAAIRERRTISARWAFPCFGAGRLTATRSSR